MNQPRLLYRDRQLVVVAKPAGMHVFSSAAGNDSLARWLCEQVPALARVGPVGQPALVHRLDRGTSGIMLAAATAASYDALRAAFATGRVDKRYLALVEGRLVGRHRLDWPLGARYRRSRRVWVADGRKPLRGVRPAHTEVEELVAGNEFTLCRVYIGTGVRHQIRAHLAHLGHPVVGDTLYGARYHPGLEAGCFFLHAWQLAFDLPGEPHRRCFSCPLPERRQALLDSLGLSVVT